MLTFFCQIPLAEPLLTKQDCPGCLVQQPVIEVFGTVIPSQIAYKNLMNAMDAYQENRAYAPKAPLRFIVQPLNPAEVLSGLTVAISGGTLNASLQVDKDGTFEAPNLEPAIAKNSLIVINRREGTILLKPYVNSFNAASDTRRLGDLRLECEITWAMEKDDLSIIERSALRLIGGLCGSSQSKVTYRVIKKLQGANLVSGGRKLALPIDKTGYGFSPPVHDRSWPDDAIIELDFNKG
jgi:hypothetical protein